MGLFGGEKKKKVPNSRKKKGAVDAAKPETAKPEQAKPAPIVAAPKQAPKVVPKGNPVSVADRAKAFNGGGTITKANNSTNKPVTVSTGGSVADRAKAFGNNKDNTTTSKATVQNTKAKAIESKPTTEDVPKKKFGLFGGKGKSNDKPKEVSKPKEVPKKAEEPSSDKKKFGLFGKAKAKETAEESAPESAPEPAPGKPGKLSKMALSINIPGLGGKRGTDLDTKSAPGKPPPQIDMYADSKISPDNQGHAGMSDEAKNKVVGPKETKLGKADWKFLYELAQQYDAYKAQEAEATKRMSPTSKTTTVAKASSEPADIKNNLNNLLGGSAAGVNFNANGSFLNNQFLNQYLVDKSSGVAFEFSNESALYMRFCRKDQEQRNISNLFAKALTKHPKAKKITQLNLASCSLPDSFLVALCDHASGLPNLQVLNLESNDLGREGIEALAKCIDGNNKKKGFKRLQILKLENQKREISAAAEEILGDAIVQSQSLVQVGLVIKGGVPKQQISNTVQANLDKLRLARREHAAKKGKLKARKRNEMEELFDGIANNKNKTTSVELTENLRFLGLDESEKVKAGAAFASNKYVTKVTMTKLKLDDEFCQTFGKSLAKNKTLETVILDSNSFSAKGIMDLLEGLGKNQSVTNFQVRHQNKVMASADEESLLPLLQNNKTLINLGIDVRNPLVQSQLQRKTNENRELQRKQRNAQKKK